MLDTKFNYEQKISYLYGKVNSETDFALRDRLVMSEIEKFKNSDTFLNSLNALIEERV